MEMMPRIPKTIGNDVTPFFILEYMICPIYLKPKAS